MHRQEKGFQKRVTNAERAKHIGYYLSFCRIILIFAERIKIGIK